MAGRLRPHRSARERSRRLPGLGDRRGHRRQDVGRLAGVQRGARPLTEGATNRRPSRRQPPSSTRATAAGNSRCSSIRMRAASDSLGIAVQHRHRRLEHDRPGVEFGRHQVDGAAGHLHAVRQRLGRSRGPGERRQQRRVNVQYRPGEALEKVGAQPPHETGQADQLHAALEQRRRQPRVECLARRPAGMGDHQRLDAGLLRPGERRHAGHVGDHDGDGGVEAPFADGVDERLEVRSAPRDQHADAPACRRVRHTRRRVNRRRCGRRQPVTRPRRPAA